MQANSVASARSPLVLIAGRACCRPISPLPAPQRLGLLASQSQGPAARPIWAHSFGNEGLVHHSYDVNAATESPSELALTNRHDEKGIKSKADLQKCCAARPHRHNHMAQDSVPLSCRRDFSWSARRSLAGGRSFARGGPAPRTPRLASILREGTGKTHCESESFDV